MGEGDGEKNGGTWQRLEGNEEGDMIKKMEQLLRTDNTEGLGKDRQLDILSLLWTFEDRHKRRGIFV